MSASIEINLEECTGCKTCVEACFVDVMRWNDIEEKPMIAYPPMKIRIRWDDPDSCPIPRTYEHAIVASGVDPEGKVGAMILHEWEKSPRGTRMRSTMRFQGSGPPGLPEIWKAHDRAEVSTFPKFLPDLYRLWQAVKNPTIKRQCSLAKNSR
jgi:NAD-dependent dihydropyrimidine dehydrogenase PreA subunit